MATLPILTRPISREKLALFLPNHESIKAFESLIDDVRETLPDAYQAAQDAADAAQTAAIAANEAANNAQTAAETAQDSADSANAAATLAQEQAAALNAVVSDLEQSQVLISELRETIHDLTRRIEALEQA